MYLSFPEPAPFGPGTEVAGDGLAESDLHLPALHSLENISAERLSSGSPEPLPPNQHASDTVVGPATGAPTEPAPAARALKAPSATVPPQQEPAGSVYELLRLIRHELKTPLTIVLGQLQLAGRQLEHLLGSGLWSGANDLAEAEQQARSLREELLRGEQHSRRLNRLIDDIVDLARIQEGEWSLRLERFNLVELLRETAQDVQHLWPARQFLLNLPGEEQALVYADELRIRQVLTNYLTNAHKYSPAAAPIELALRIEPEQVGVLVRDYGPGLPFEEQARVWERFYRVPGIVAQQETEGGSGLGLTICQQLMNQHYGQVGVFSAPGAGAIFWFTLPRVLS